MKRDYPTCARAYATLSIYHDRFINKDTLQTLRMEPTHEVVASSRGSGGKAHPARWSVETSQIVESDDIRLHLEWLVEKLRGKEDAFARLRREGHKTVISIYWLSKHGHGGPILSPSLMTELGTLGVELWFDIYFISQSSTATK